MVDRLTGRLRAGGAPPACGRCPGRGGAAVRFLLMARPPILHARGHVPPDNRLMTDRNELCFTPAQELARRIRARELSPVELLEAVLARVDAVDGRVHAFMTVDAERAMAAAREAEAALRRGGELGPLHGLPVS